MEMTVRNTKKQQRQPPTPGSGFSDAWTVDTKLKILAARREIIRALRNTKEGQTMQNFLNQELDVITGFINELKKKNNGKTYKN